MKKIFGDLLYQSNGRWETLVFSSHGGNEKKLIESLSIIRSLEPTVVEINREEWFEAIETNILKLSKHA